MPVNRARTRWSINALRDPVAARWVPVLVTILVGVGAAWTSFGVDLDRGLQTWRSGLLSHSATGRLVLVEIDARSLAAFRRWPWPRDQYVAAIAALNRAGAETIAFDVDFSAPSTPDQDGALAEAIATSAAPITLPTFRQAGSQDGQEVLENLPIPMLRDRAALAAVNIFADRDGLVRSYPYGIITGGIPRPSIGAMLAGAAGRAGSGFPIDLSIDPATVPRIGFVDLLSGRFPRDMLKGRNVLIGASAIELGDRYPLPGRGVIPGPIIQLLAAETLLQRSMPTAHGSLLPLLIAAAAIAGAARGRASLGFAISSVGGITTLILPLASEWARFGTFPVASAMLALLAGTVAITVRSGLRSLWEARHSDGETGLPNGRAFHEAVADRKDAAVVVLRLSNFGDIASVLGRAQAADLIARIAERLAHAGDTPIHRIDESALAWLTITCDPEEEEQRVDAAAAMLRAPFDLAGRQVELSFGFGLACSSERDAATRAAKAAEDALTRSVRWSRYTEDMSKESAWRLSLAAELDQAMSAGQIWVAYQPKLHLATRRITAAEALVRWRHPERGNIPPDAFIPALEESGRIADLTLHVLERALTDREEWSRQGVELDVAVNLSASLPSDGAFVERLEAVLLRHAGSVTHLTLEVTESATMANPELAIEALDRLARLGLALSIDDYGTGLSTLSYLKRLPAREIKIDKGFVLSLETSRGDQAMVRSTIDLAHELGFKVVAEGVETETALQMLVGFGCDVAQGWHIGRPIPAPDLAAMAAGRFAKAS